MLEVVYLISRARPSGPVNQALNILLGMKMNKRVHAVLVTLAPEEKNNSWLQRFYDNGIEVVQFGQSILKTLKCISKLEQYVKEHHVCVIHSAGYRADFVSIFAKVEAKKVSTQRCLPNEVAEKLPRIVRPILERWHLQIIQKMDRIVACSRSLQEVLIDDYGLQVDAVQNGVNTALFAPLAPLEKMELRSRLGYKDSSIIYLVLGRLSKRKNIGIIIDAFKCINRRDIMLLIVGDGPLRAELEQKAGNDKRIIFIGNTTVPLPYLQSSDILISSALAEGLPNTVLEALSCGLPCILSDIDPHKEIVQGTDLDCLFECQSVDQIISSILLSLEWDIQEKSLKARSLAEQKFGLLRLANEYENVYYNTIRD